MAKLQESLCSIFEDFLVKWTRMLMRALRSDVMQLVVTAQREASLWFLSWRTSSITEEEHPGFYMGLGACGLLIIHQICSRAEMHPGLQLSKASRNHIHAFSSRNVVVPRFRSWLMVHGTSLFQARSSYAVSKHPRLLFTKLLTRFYVNTLWLVT